MADKRGGSRVPNKPASYSGVGKNSRRTDGQPVRAPHVQEGTDLTQGDRRVIEARQSAAPLGTQSSPRIATPTVAPSGGGVAAELPQHLFEMPTARPGEDPMTPPPEAPMEPADDKEVVLQFLIDNFQDGNAQQMLQEYRAQRQVPDEAPMEAPQGASIFDLAEPPADIEGGEEEGPVTDFSLPQPRDEGPGGAEAAPEEEVAPSLP